MPRLPLQVISTESALVNKAYCKWQLRSEHSRRGILVKSSWQWRHEEWGTSMLSQLVSRLTPSSSDCSTAMRSLKVRT